MRPSLSLMAGCCRAAGVAGTSMGVAGEAGASKVEEVLEGSCTSTQCSQSLEIAMALGLYWSL